jgi:hypothetical protein
MDKQSVPPPVLCAQQIDGCSRCASQHEDGRGLCNISPGTCGQSPSRLEWGREPIHKRRDVYILPCRHGKYCRSLCSELPQARKYSRYLAPVLTAQKAVPLMNPAAMASFQAVLNLSRSPAGVGPASEKVIRLFPQSPEQIGQDHSSAFRQGLGIAPYEGKSHAQPPEFLKS